MTRPWSVLSLPTIWRVLGICDGLNEMGARFDAVTWEWPGRYWADA